MYRILIRSKRAGARIIKTKYYSTKITYDKWKKYHISMYSNVYMIEGYILKNDKWKKI